eukprot:g19154.t1
MTSARELAAIGVARTGARRHREQQGAREREIDNLLVEMGHTNSGLVAGGTAGQIRPVGATMLPPSNPMVAPTGRFNQHPEENGGTTGAENRFSTEFQKRQAHRDFLQREDFETRERLKFEQSVGRQLHEERGDVLEEKAKLFVAFERGFATAETDMQREISDIKREHDFKCSALQRKIEKVQGDIERFKQEKMQLFEKRVGVAEGGVEPADGRTIDADGVVVLVGRGAEASSNPAPKQFVQAPLEPILARLASTDADQPVDDAAATAFHEAEFESEIAHTKRKIEEKKRWIDVLKLKRRVPQTENVELLKKMAVALSVQARAAEYAEVLKRVDCDGDTKGADDVDVQH